MNTQDDADTAESPEPTLIDLVREVREALGLFSGAMDCSPKEAWDEAIAVARRLAGTRPIDVFSDDDTVGVLPHYDGDPVSDHEFRPVKGHPDDDECAHRRDDLAWALKFMTVDGTHTQGVKDRLTVIMEKQSPTDGVAK